MIELLEQSAAALVAEGSTPYFALANLTNEDYGLILSFSDLQDRAHMDGVVPSYWQDQAIMELRLSTKKMITAIRHALRQRNKGEQDAAPG